MFPKLFKRTKRERRLLYAVGKVILLLMLCVRSLDSSSRTYLLLITQSLILLLTKELW